MKTSWEKLADIDDNIEQQLELAQSASSASNPTIPLVRVIPFRRMRSSTIAGTVAESLESSLDSYRRQNNQTIIYFNFNIVNNTIFTNGCKTNCKIHKQVSPFIVIEESVVVVVVVVPFICISNASSPVHISAEFTRSRNRVFSSDPSILLKVDKDLFPEISTRGLKHHHLPIIQERKLSNFSASDGFLQPNRNFMSASSTPHLQSVASSSFSYLNFYCNVLSYGRPLSIIQTRHISGSQRLFTHANVLPLGRGRFPFDYDRSVTLFSKLQSNIYQTNEKF
ncbi:hypothetical protein Tsp_11333 [Trichinella spiralis]|uniref:hypothetical protein n=1 Tax=Trichinella spiralis TaxID=6334 RepID=UPI0001EFD1EB|nr:hypothetical protein Tsp_11333 [Trichinella spiralis]